MSASTGTTVGMLVAVLVLLGLGMIALAVWLVRSTRSDPQALGPLEVMGDRRFRKGDPDRRQTHLDTARPAGAPPPAPMVAPESGDGDGDGAEPDVDETSPALSPGNSDASTPDLVASGQSSAEDVADGGQDVRADAALGNSDASTPDPVVSGQSSSAEAAAAANSDASTPDPVVSGQSSDDAPAGVDGTVEADKSE